MSLDPHMSSLKKFAHFLIGLLEQDTFTTFIQNSIENSGYTYWKRKIIKIHPHLEEICEIISIFSDII